MTKIFVIAIGVVCAFSQVLFADEGGAWNGLSPAEAKANEEKMVRECRKTAKSCIKQELRAYQRASLILEGIKDQETAAKALPRLKKVIPELEACAEEMKHFRSTGYGYRPYREGRNLIWKSRKAYQKAQKRWEGELRRLTEAELLSDELKAVVDQIEFHEIDESYQADAQNDD